MPKFSYVGVARDGSIKKGLIDAANVADAEAKLRAQQIMPSNIKRAWGAIEIRLPRLSGIKTRTLVVFTRQLATMIDAGLPLVQCLDILASQEPDREFQKVIMGIKVQVETGSTFADALKRYPKVFDNLFVSLVAAGEVGGILDTILNRLAQYLEKSMKTMQKVRSALKYPTFVIIVAIGILTLMLWKIIPAFATMFQGTGKKSLPALTQFTVNLSNRFIEYLPYIAIVVVILVLAFRYFSKTKFGRRMLDGLLLKLPIIGPILRKSAVARFTRTLGTLVASGVPILDGLEVVARSAGNVIIENGILYTRAKVAEGKNIAGPLDETRMFPKMVVQMIAVGESTGAMDVMLTKIADFYDDEVDAAVDALTSLLEPLIMIVIGGMVGFMMVSMYLPIFTMAENLSGAK